MGPTARCRVARRSLVLVSPVERLVCETNKPAFATTVRPSEHGLRPHTFLEIRTVSSVPKCEQNGIGSAFFGVAIRASRVGRLC